MTANNFEVTSDEEKGRAISTAKDSTPIVVVTEDLRRLGLGTLVVIALGIISIAVYSLDTTSWSAYMRVVSLSTLIGGAFGLLGMLLGFLFGVPITDPRKEEITAGAGTVPLERAQVGYKINTSLEQISDWLTKILVGVGLTQLQQIPGKIRQAAQALGSGLPGGEQHTGFVMAVLLYAATSGFLLGYLWTRIVFAPWFRSADDKLFEKIIKAEKAEQVSQEAEVKQLKAEQVSQEAEVKQLKAEQVSQEAEVRKQEAEQLLESAKELNEVLRNMHDDLYREPPQGFRDAIEKAQGFIRKWEEPTQVMFWIRLAAAYGQQYAWEKSENITSETHLETKQKAFDAIDKALQSNRALAKYWMNYLGNKDEKKPADENDLEVFWDDEEFQRRFKQT